MMFQLWFHALGCSIITLPVALSWGGGFPCIPMGWSGRTPLDVYFVFQ